MVSKHCLLQPQNALIHVLVFIHFSNSILCIYRTLLKATVILLPLLGITWMFGLLAVNQESSVFAWIFTILNSLQVN